MGVLYDIGIRRAYESFNKNTWRSTGDHIISRIPDKRQKTSFRFLDHRLNPTLRIRWCGPYKGQIKATGHFRRIKFDWSVSFFPFEAKGKFEKNFKKVSLTRVSNPWPFEQGARF